MGIVFFQCAKILEIYKMRNFLSEKSELNYKKFLIYVKKRHYAIKMRDSILCVM